MPEAVRVCGITIWRFPVSFVRLGAKLLHPLISLRRSISKIIFYEGASTPSESQRLVLGELSTNSMAGNRRQFRSQDEAATYLRFWAADYTAVSELKWLHQRSRVPTSTAHTGPDGWIWALAASLVTGELVVMDETIRGARLGRVSGPSTAASATGALDDLPPLTNVAVVPALPDFLPILEDIQIESAQVKPEIEAALKELAIAISGVGDAGANVKPVPATIAGVSDKLAETIASVKKKLDE